MIYLNINNLSESDAFELCISKKHPLEYEENIEYYYLQEIVISEKDIETKFDKKKLIKRVFDFITKNSTNDIEKITKWVRFLQDKFIHPYIREPRHIKNSDKTVKYIYDTIFLLVNNIAKCGQVNIVLIDGLNIYYNKTRLVQLWKHIACEVYINNKWCYLDSNFLRNGEIIRNKNNEIASAEEIYNDNNLLKQITTKYYYTDIDKLLQDKNKFKHLWNENNYKNIKNKYNLTNINNFINFISGPYARLESIVYKVFNVKPTYYTYDIFSTW